MESLKKRLLLSCFKATELIDKKSVIRLSAYENTMLHIHTSICAACRQYQKQSKIMDHLLQQHLQKIDPDQVPQFINDELKIKVFSLLNKN